MDTAKLLSEFRARSTYWLLALLLALLFFDHPAYRLALGGFQLRFAQLLAAGLFAYALLHYWRSRRPWPGSYLDSAIAGYLLVNLIAISQSAWLARAVRIFLLLASLALVYWAVYWLTRSTGRFGRAVDFLLFLGMAEIVYGLYQVVAGMVNWYCRWHWPVGPMGIIQQRYLSSPWGRPYGTMVEPDFYGAVCLFFALFFLVLHYSSIRAKRHWWCGRIGWPLALLGLFFSFVRGCWLVFLLLLPLLPLLRRRWPVLTFGWRQLAAWLLIIALAVSAGYFFSPPLHTILKERMAFKEDDSSLGLKNIRALYARISLQYVPRHFMLGYGPGGFAYLFLLDRIAKVGAWRTMWEQRTVTSDTNIVLTALNDTGILGLLLLLFLCWRFITANWRGIAATGQEASLRLGLFLASSGLLATYLFTTGLWLPLTWGFVGLSMAGLAERRDDAAAGGGLRIGFDAKWYFTGNPSGRVVVRNLLAHLLAANREHTFYVFLKRGDRRRAFPLSHPRLRLVYLPGKLNLLANLFFVPLWSWRLHLDVLLLQYFAPPFSRAKRLVFIYDAIFKSHPHYFSWRERLYFEPMRWLARRADVVIAESEYVKKSLTLYRFAAAERIAVIHCGVDERFFARSAPVPELNREVRLRYGLPDKFALYIGRWNVRKNIANLIAAFALLQHRDLKLVLAGESDRKAPDLQALIRKNGLAERVLLIGFVPDDLLPALLTQAALFCYVSFAEGFGLPVLEAMANGRPVVVSARGALPEICAAAGNYVNPEKPEEIARMIDFLLDNEKIAAEKVRLGLARAELFSWRQAAEKLLALCQEVAHDPGTVSGVGR